jgi:hypothetical protein
VWSAKETAMTNFQCIPIPTEIADRFRATGTDDNGNTLRRMNSTGGTGFPCRHCLAFAAAGDPMLLGSYNLPRPRGIYWTPSPIFVHAEPCARFAEPDRLAQIVAEGALVSLRAYDSADQCLYDLGQVGAGTAPLARALADPRCAFINFHTAKPGCLLSQIARSD